MRPLTVLVLAESLVIALLVVLWLGGAPATAERDPAREAGPDAAVLTQVTGALPASASEPIERRVAAPLPAGADDLLGILVGGTVLSPDGAPIADANVYFRRLDEYRGGSSQANGTYAAAGLQPGEWRLGCRADGFPPYETKVTLDQRPFQQFDIELRRSYVVKVKFQNAAGEFLPELIAKKSWFGELSVVATALPLPGDLPLTERPFHVRLGAGEWVTNSGAGRDPDKKLRAEGYAGELWLDQDPPVHAALVLRHVVLQRLRIEPGQHELVFTLEADEVFDQLGSVVLRLVDDATGQPLAKAPVSVCMPHMFTSGQVTDDDGRIAAQNFPPGPFTVTSWVKGYEAVFRYVRMPPGGKLDLGDIRLSPSVLITANAVDAEGKPVADAEFQFTSLDDRTFPQPLRDRHISRVDASGQTKLALGRHRYVVSARSRSQGFGYATVDASNGTPPPLVITLCQPTPVGLRVHVDNTVGYMVTILDQVRSPVRVLPVAGEHRPEATSLPPGTYTVEIHDAADRLVRSFALTVGSEPLTIDVP